MYREHIWNIVAMLDDLFKTYQSLGKKRRKLHIGMFGPTQLFTPNRKCKVHSNRFRGF